MKIIFIADAHLKGEGEAAEADLLAFLDSINDADHLVILGDLFDFWTGRNTVAHERYKAVLAALEDLSRRGTTIIYVEGNHDFSMGPFFTERLKAHVIKEAETLTLDNKKFYLAHGDTVDMTDGYRRWRGFLRSSAYTALTSVLPSSVVWNIAMHLSGRSRSYNTKGSALDEHLREFAKKIIAHGADFVVMAHSHLAGVHKIKSGTYANPGGWQGERTYLEYEKGKMRVKKYRRRK
jgi:UDP-2,3-diacylglucosamine hydrolase